MEYDQCVYLLQQFINKVREPTDYAQLTEYLPRFFETVSAVGAIKVDMLRPQEHCAICLVTIPNVESSWALGCRKNHLACSWSCLAAYVDQCFWFRKIEFRSIPCPQCQSNLSAQQCEYILSSYATLQNLESPTASDSSATEVSLNVSTRMIPVEPAEPKVVHTFDCEICYSTGVIEDEITLDCVENHRFHKECLADFFESLIDERKVSEKDVCCLKCHKPIGPYILKNISPKRYPEYEVLAAKMAAQEIVGKDEKISYESHRFCPKCSTYVIIDQAISSVTCLNDECRYAYCVKCGKPLHMGACDVKGDEGYLLPRLEKWMAQQDQAVVRPCPKCNQIIFRDEGCKFMTCKSDKCRGQTFFCMACGKVLKQRHEDHPCVVSGKDYKGSRLKHYGQRCDLM